MAFEPGTGTLFASIVNGTSGAADDRIWSLGNINTSTGDVTEIGETVEGLDGIAFCGDEPEPPSGPIVIIPTMGEWGMIFAILLLGLYAVLKLRRRKYSEN